MTGEWPANRLGREGGFRASPTLAGQQWSVLTWNEQRGLFEKVQKHKTNRRSELGSVDSNPSERSSQAGGDGVATLSSCRRSPFPSLAVWEPLRAETFPSGWLLSHALCKLEHLSRTHIGALWLRDPREPLPASGTASQPAPGSMDQ